MKYAIFLVLLVFAAFMGIGLIAYLTRYDYMTVDDQALRVNRMTGQTDVLRPGQGWRPIRTAAARPYTPAPRTPNTSPCTEDEFKLALDPASEKVAHYFPAESNERLRFCKQRLAALAR